MADIGGDAISFGASRGSNYADCWLLHVTCFGVSGIIFVVETKNWRKKINNELGAGAERMNIVCWLGLHKWRYIAEYTSRLPTMRKVREENRA